MRHVGLMALRYGVSVTQIITNLGSEFLQTGFCSLGVAVTVLSHETSSDIERGKSRKIIFRKSRSPIFLGISLYTFIHQAGSFPKDRLFIPVNEERVFVVTYLYNYSNFIVHSALT